MTVPPTPARQAGCSERGGGSASPANGLARCPADMIGTRGDGADILPVIVLRALKCEPRPRGLGSRNLHDERRRALASRRALADGIGLGPLRSRCGLARIITRPPHGHLAARPFAGSAVPWNDLLGPAPWFRGAVSSAARARRRSKRAGPPTTEVGGPCRRSAPPSCAAQPLFCGRRARAPTLVTAAWGVVSTLRRPHEHAAGGERQRPEGASESSGRSGESGDRRSPRAQGRLTPRRAAAVAPPRAAARRPPPACALLPVPTVAAISGDERLLAEAAPARERAATSSRAHGDALGDPLQLVQPVRDVDDAHALGLIRRAREET